MASTQHALPGVNPAAPAGIVSATHPQAREDRLRELSRTISREVAEAAREINPQRRSFPPWIGPRVLSPLLVLMKMRPRRDQPAVALRASADPNR